MNKQTRVTPIGPKQENKNPMNVDVQVILEDYRKQVSDLEWAVKVKDAQIKNLQKALQEAENSGVHAYGKDANRDPNGHDF